jgi:hypothetical protein
MSTEYFIQCCTITFFSETHGTFSKIDHILGHKASLSKYKKIKIISCILSDHNALKLETCKQLEAEQHIAQWSMGHWWNKRGN